MKTVHLFILSLVSFTTTACAQFIYSFEADSNRDATGRINQYNTHGDLVRTIGDNLSYSAGIAAGSSGYVYAVSNSFIRKYDLDGNLLLTFGTKVHSRSALAIDVEGNVLAVGTNNNGQDSNYKIQTFSSSGNFISEFSTSTFSPRIAVSNDGSIFLSATSILKYSSAGSFLGSFGRISSDSELAINSSGSIYAKGADWNSTPTGTIVKYSQDGELEAEFGSGSVNNTREGGIAIGENGTIYGVNSSYGISMFSSDGTFQSAAFSNTYSLSFIATGIPEPSALSLLAVGLGWLAMMRRRRS
jgi:hypothetical protein